jgi:hypothetical protein
LQKRRLAPALASLDGTVHIVTVPRDLDVHDSRRRYFLRLSNDLVLVPDTSASSLGFTVGIRLNCIILAHDSLFQTTDSASSLLLLRGYQLRQCCFRCLLRPAIARLSWKVEFDRVGDVR